MALLSPNLIFDLESVTSSGDSVMLKTESGELIKFDAKLYKQLINLFRETNNVSDITDEEYEEAVSVFELLSESGITEKNKVLFQEMKEIVEEYENSCPSLKKYFNVMD